jgi:hypothetical protein
MHHVIFFQATQYRDFRITTYCVAGVHREVDAMAIGKQWKVTTCDGSCELNQVCESSMDEADVTVLKKLLE